MSLSDWVNASIDFYKTETKNIECYMETRNGSYGKRQSKPGLTLPTLAQGW